MKRHKLEYSTDKGRVSEKRRRRLGELSAELKDVLDSLTPSEQIKLRRDAKFTIALLGLN